MSMITNNDTEDSILSNTSGDLLDLFSTIQTSEKKCINHAPYLCVPPEGERPGYLAQGCCNDWSCPRCGELRAKYEYGRMVHGARELGKDRQLWFITITCSGDMSLSSAEQSYYGMVNAMLTACRTQATRKKLHWAYVAVTERQKRGHPHSHLLTTFCPIDAYAIIENYHAYSDSVARINAKIPLSMRFTAQPVKHPTDPKKDLSFLDYHSEWLMLEAVKVGLGVQCRVSMVDSVEACSRYVAKYLFKQTAFDIWPKGWKRVRYSRNWPKLPEKHNPKAFVILSAWDWYLAADCGSLVTTSYTVYERALAQGLRNVTWRQYSDTVSN